MHPHNSTGFARATIGAAHNANVIDTNGEISTCDPRRDHFQFPSPCWLERPVRLLAQVLAQQR